MAKTIATSEVAMPGKRTVLKGLIGHSNSSGDQAPWEWNGENPVLCLALSSHVYIFMLYLLIYKYVITHLRPPRYGITLNAFFTDTLSRTYLCNEQGNTIVAETK